MLTSSSWALSFCHSSTTVNDLDETYRYMYMYLHVLYGGKVKVTVPIADKNLCILCDFYFKFIILIRVLCLSLHLLKKIK